MGQRPARRQACRAFGANGANGGKVPQRARFDGIFNVTERFVQQTSTVIST